MDDNFDEEKFVFERLGNSSESKNLSNSLNHVYDAIKSHIIENNIPLLHQSLNIDQLEIIIQEIKKRIDDIQATYNSILTSIDSPLESLKLKQKQLESVQYTSQILRKIQKFLFLSSRVRSNYEYWKKTSQDSSFKHSSAYPLINSTMKEIRMLLKSDDLNGINIIEKEKEFIQQIEDLMKKD